jgi:tetratricopeptide (TPR) repeat protein
MLPDHRPAPIAAPPRRARWARAASLALALLAGMGWWWWRGRPERHLQRAERLLEREPVEALAWLPLPEATPATRDRARLVRARASLQRGRPAEAVGPLEAIDPRGPQAADAAFWKGRTLYAVGQYLQAFTWFRQAAALRPEDAEAHRWVAAAAYDLGALDQAFDALEAAIRLDPDHAPTRRTRALLFREQVNWERAQVEYEATLRLDPDQPQARFELARCLKALGRHAEAERQLRACRGRVPEADRLSLLAECLYERGEREQLRPLLDSALSRAPDHPGLLARRGMLALADGRPAEAIRDLDPALAARPSEVSWLYQRAMALQQLGRTDEARRDRATVAGLKADEERLSDLEAEASRRLEDPELRVKIAELCARLGRDEMAASWYRAALACDASHAAARSGLASLRAR